MTEFNLTYTLILMLIVFAAIMGTVAYLTFGERKISAYIQDRVGPNRVGPWGTLQVVADGIKFFLKEDIIPKHVDRVFYFLAPAVGVATAMLAFSIVPFGPSVPPPGPVPVTAERPLEAAVEQHRAEMDAYQSQRTYAIAPGLDIGILFAFALGNLVVYGVILGGWSSGSKYSLLGSLRSSAQIISYEIPLGMSVLGVFLFVGSVNLERILDYQIHHGWFILYQPLAFLLFLTAVFAECNRQPFDLPEAEQELVGGFHTEYGAMKLGLMLMVDYIHMITTSFFMAILFFGGWHLPGVTDNVGGVWGVILKFVILGAKVFFFLMLFYLVRWTIPRFKFDQLMGLAWQVMIPLAIINLLCVMVVREFNLSPWILTVTSVVTFLAAAVVSTWEKSTVVSRPAREPLAASQGV